MKLHVRACSARNLMEVQTFGELDPFCKLSLRDRSFKTRVHECGSTTHVWNEAFVFTVENPQLDQLVVKVKDKGMTGNKLVGECRLPVNMFLSGSIVDQWYTIMNESERAGEINLRVQYTGPRMQPVAPRYYAQQYPASSRYPASSSGYYQQPPPQYQPPTYHYAQPPPPQYAPQSYHPPPPQPAYGYPSGPPTTAVYTSGPPVLVAQGGSPYSHHHHHEEYDSDDSKNDVMNTALAAGAGVLGAMVVGDVLEDVFD